MKKIMTLILMTLNLYGYNQILLVVADEFNSTTASLQAYEYEGFFYRKKFKPIEVNLGRSGLAWADDDHSFDHNQSDLVKHEGDGKAPAGIFTLSSAFGYDSKIETKMPYIRASKDLICVDDSKSEQYNKLVKINRNIQMSSFEWMRRDDNLYELGITVDHNIAQAANSGSCIFLHIQRDKNSPSSGCTTMQKSDLKNILSWLNPEKNPKLIQITRSSCKELNKKLHIRCED